MRLFALADCRSAVRNRWRTSWRLRLLGAGVGLATIGWPAAARAQLAVSANDAKIVLVDGVQTPVRNPPPDTVTILDLSASTPRVIADVRAPTSVIGPPESVAIAPDGSIALVTASTKIDPADPTKTIPDDTLTVIDLKAARPAVIATLHAGSGAAGVSISPTGALALVANRSEGSVSIFTIDGKIVTPAGKVVLGPPESLPSHVAFTPDGRTALVTRNGDSLVSLLTVDGTTVRYLRRDIAAGGKPYVIEVTRFGDAAVIGNIGNGGTGGVDTVNVIDLMSNPPRVVHELPVGAIAEGLALSRDDAYVAVTVMNGSNSPKASPNFRDFGLLKILRLSNRTLTPVTEANIGHWCQGVAWSADGRTLLVQCMVEKEIMVFHFDGRKLSPGASIKINGGPAAIRTAPR